MCVKDPIPPPELEVLFEDDQLIVLNKPRNLLMHRTPMSPDRVFLLQRARRQFGVEIHLIHRLDRATSGVLLISKTKSLASRLSVEFQERRVLKRYEAILRGWPSDQEIDYPIAREPGHEPQPAQSRLSVLRQSEIDVQTSKRYPTSRYALVELFPKTGKRNQLRRHMNHIRHPILGDTRYGCNKQNKFLRDVIGRPGLCLHAREIQFHDPRCNTLRTFSARPPVPFLGVVRDLGLA